MSKKKLKYGHVGRPTNEEVNKFKKKKTLKIIGIILCSVFIIGGTFWFFNSENLEFSSIMGDATANKRVMTYIGSDKTTAYVVSCPVGYKLKYNYGDNTKKIVENRNYYCQRPTSSKKKKNATVLKIPFYVQNDYNSTSSRCGGGNLNNKGCLPTVGAMVFSALLDKEITPIDMNNDAYGYSSSNICSDSSYSITFLENYAKSNGVKVNTYVGNNATNRTKIIAKLRTGKCVGVAALEKKYLCVGNTKNLCYDNYGHFIMFYAHSYYGSKVYVNDPAKKNGKMFAIKDYKLSEIISSAQNDKVRVFCK